MTAKSILAELESLGSDSYKQLLMRNHGIVEPFFGVKISEMKKIQRRIKRDYQLALDLYDSGNYDAMYFAGLIADDARMTKKDLQRWVEKALCGGLPGATVAWVAAGGRYGWELGMKWIDSDKSHIAVAGWGTLACVATIHDDAQLDLTGLKALVDRVRLTIHQAPDRVRYAMNGFIISVGCCVKPLSLHALTTAQKIGPVSADLGNNDCKMPWAPDYIHKVQLRGEIGKKRKSVKC